MTIFLKSPPGIKLVNVDILEWHGPEGECRWYAYQPINNFQQNLAIEVLPCNPSWH